MKRFVNLAAAAALLAVPVVGARADLVLTQLTINTGQGFGNAQTIFTMQVTGGNTTTPPGPGAEWGCYAFGNVKGAYSAADNNFSGTGVNVGNFCAENAANQVANGSPKNALPTLSDAGILSVGEIGLLLNNNQVSDAGITLNAMVLSFYTPGGDVIFSATLPTGWCNINALCSGANTFLKSENGQGGSGFVFLLNQTQQNALAQAITNSGFALGDIGVGAAGNFGCGATQGADCKEANDGAESLSLARVNAVSITPEPSAAVLLATGFLGLAGFARRRRNK